MPDLSILGNDPIGLGPWRLGREYVAAFACLTTVNWPPAAALKHAYGPNPGPEVAMARPTRDKKNRNHSETSF